MRLNLRMLTAVAALLSVVAFAPAALAQKSGGVLKFYHRGTPPSGSIHEEATNSTLSPYMGVFNNLIMYDHQKPTNSLDTIIPDLATSWEWKNDKTKLTFKLRKGVKWHDGKPFTAKDVQCTWDLLQGKKTPKLRKNPRKAWYKNLDKVTVDNDYQATFHLKRRQPAFLTLLASGYSPVYPCHVPPKKMRTSPIGTGPFKFVQLKQNEFVKFTKNKDYWKQGQPYLDGHEWTIIKSRSTRVLAFVAGKFDMTFNADVTIPLLKDVREQAPDAQCSLVTTNVSTNLIVNQDKPPFNDADIREAMVLTIDRDAFIKILGHGKTIKSGALLPPPGGVWGMPPNVLANVAGYGADVEANRDRAKAIMKRKGYDKDNPLKVKVSTRNIAVYRDPAVILIDHLNKIGFAAELETVETSNWHAKVGRKDYSVGLNLTGIGVDDPDAQFYENYSCGSQRNYTGYCKPEMEKLFEKQSMMDDQNERKKLVWDIDKRLQEDAARPIIFNGVAAQCWHPHVKGFIMMTNSLYNGWRLEDVWLDK